MNLWYKTTDFCIPALFLPLVKTNKPVKIKTERGEDMKICKRTLALCCAILLVACGFPKQVSAAGDAFSWYCAHVKNHQKPQCGAEMNFIDEYDGYYIGNGDEKVVYLTFDAGYENGNVEKILNVLKEENVPGAFFILGHLIADQPELVKRMADEGHLVCNHTFHHKDMTKMTSKEQFTEELASLENAYHELTGKELSKFYRPPEGRFSEQNLKWGKEMGYCTVFWSFGYPDWDNNRQMAASTAKEKILSNLHPGEVMLLHPTSATNAAILGDIIREIKAEGYRFGTLDELTGHEP